MRVEAMRAAVIAIRAGIFDDVNNDVPYSGQAPGAAVAGRTYRSAAGRAPWATGDASPVVLVVACHAGAGASTVALAVAEVLAVSRRSS
ncbi:hypothetical protein [Blastococcus sp. SYSU DS0616]